MKFYYTFFFIFVFLCCSSQEIIDKESFKKCKKEFSKKICLSDEDGDGVLFYLDHCPKEAGSKENNGCPKPDTDGDGIWDMEDACPTIAGMAENNGCPIQKLDCTKFYEEEKLKFEKFKDDNKNLENIYDLLNINILYYFKKENKNIGISEVYIDFLNYGPQSLYYPRNYVPRCESTKNTDEYNFLITKFWNKKALESFVSKNNTSIRMSYYFQKYEDSYNGILPKELHDFLVKRKISDTKVIISSKEINRISNKILLEIKIKFINPYQLMINYTPFTGGVHPVSKKLEYQNGKWIELKE